MSVEGPDQGQPNPDSVEATAEESGAALAELQQLLFGTQQKELRRIQTRIDDPKLHAEDISRVLAEAVALRPHPDVKLAVALAPTLQEAFKVSVKKDPQSLVDAISPVMGPAIRKSISDALERMVQSLNQTLEYGFSPKGLKWRIEAFRTGKPFAEVVLLHTLQYRVEQLFLIHRKDGLLLQHVAVEPGMTQDADMVSGMLTAIQDFVRDSFGGPEGGSLDQARVGEMTIWIEQSPGLVLAAVVRGSAPQRLRWALQDAVEKIQIEMARQLEAFAGDVNPFESSRPLIEACLLQAGRDDGEPDAKPKKKKGLALPIICIVLLAGIGTWVFFSVRASHRWSRYLDRLTAEPGIVVTSSGKRNGGWFVEGLRDPLAIDPDQLARSSGIDWRKIHGRWEPYYAFEPTFALARARAALNPPRGVSLSLKAGVLNASGTADAEWVAKFQSISLLVPGVSGHSEVGLVQLSRPGAPSPAPPPDVGFVLAQTNRIESLQVKFVDLSADIRADQKPVLEAAANVIHKLSGAMGRDAQGFHVIIVAHGHSSAGPPPLIRQRAGRVLLELIKLGAPPTVLGVDFSDDGGPNLSVGNVSFKVVAGNNAPSTRASP